MRRPIVSEPAYSNRTLAERLGWHAHEHHGRWYLHTWDHIAEGCGDYREWCGTAVYLDAYAAWTEQGPEFEHDAFAMVELMGRLTQLGYWMALTAGHSPPSPYLATLWTWPPRRDGYFYNAQAATPQEALARAAWEATATMESQTITNAE